MLYLVRNKTDRTLLGVFYAIDTSMLFNLIDEQCDPYGVEFHEIDTPGGAIWFEKMSEEEDCDNDKYPLVDAVSFSEDIDAAMYDGYQQTLNGKNDDEMEWSLFTGHGFDAVPEVTREILASTCSKIEVIKHGN